MGCLYKLTFPNGKSYVGITTGTAAQRFAEHCSDSRSKRQSDRLVCRAIRKFGPLRVFVEIIAEESDWRILCEMERIGIKEMRTRAPDGYNLTDGGDGTLGFIPSESTKLKIRASLIGNKRKLGKKESDVTRALKSKAHTKAWSLMSKEKRQRKLSGFAEHRRSPQRAAAVSRTKLGTYAGGVSGSVGIAFVKGRWRARGKHKQRCVHLGYFDKIEDAILARLNWQLTMEEQGAREWTQSNCVS